MRRISPQSWRAIFSYFLIDRREGLWSLGAGHRLESLVCLVYPAPPRAHAIHLAYLEEVEIEETRIVYTWRSSRRYQERQQQVGILVDNHPLVSSESFASTGRLRCLHFRTVGIVVSFPDRDKLIRANCENQLTRHNHQDFSLVHQFLSDNFPST